MNTITIRSLQASDWPAVRAIYTEGIATGNATFESEPPDAWEAWQAGKLPGCNLAAQFGKGTLVGWGVLSATSARAVYRGVAEVSVYVTAAARGRGVGMALLVALVAASEAQGIWMLQAGIFPENTASVRLHARAGFRQVGIREKIGRMAYGPHAGAWRDVLLMERRSSVVGLD